MVRPYNRGVKGKTSVNRIGLGLALMVVIAACGNDTAATTRAGVPTSSTTTTLDPAVVEAQQFEADAALTRSLWGDYSDSFYEGAEATARFIVDHIHPDMGYGIDDYLCWAQANPSGYHEQAIVDMGSIIHSDGWRWPGNADSAPSGIDGQVPRGRLYALQVEFVFESVSVSDSSDPVTYETEVHVAILGEGDLARAYFFFDSYCG